MNRAITLACVAALTFGAVSARAEPPAVTHDWPAYRGGNNQFADVSGAKLIDDMSQAQLLWESEEQRIGFAKTHSGYGGNPSSFGDLDPAGVGSPIVASGLVIMAYAAPSGEAYDEDAKKGLAPEVWEKYKHKFRIEADDVVIAMDAATGKTKWKAVFPRAGRNPGSGKRNLYGTTPVALDGRVFALGYCGALYALDLKTGKPLWQLPNWENLEKAKQEAIKNKTGGKGISAPTGWLMTSGGVLLATTNTGIHPRYGGATRGYDPASGKLLWELANVNANLLAPATVAGKECLVSPTICVESKTGKVFWRKDEKPIAISPAVFGKSLLLSYTAHPKSSEMLNLKEGDAKKGENSFGRLTGFAVDESGAKVQWTLPPEYRKWMLPDDGGWNYVAARDGVVYHLCQYSEAGDTWEACLIAVREADGKVLARVPHRATVPYLWGDRLITVTDTAHRPRAANAEKWQMFDPDPANFGPLGMPWHINGKPEVHTATGGYEMLVLEAFADGLAFFRVAGGIRCYDLRKK